MPIEEKDMCKYCGVYFEGCVCGPLKDWGEEEENWDFFLPPEPEEGLAHPQYCMTCSVEIVPSNVFGWRHINAIKEVEEHEPTPMSDSEQVLWPDN